MLLENRQNKKKLMRPHLLVILTWTDEGLKSNIYLFSPTLQICVLSSEQRCWLHSDSIIFRNLEKQELVHRKDAFFLPLNTHKDWLIGANKHFSTQDFAVNSIKQRHIKLETPVKQNGTEIPLFLAGGNKNVTNQIIMPLASSIKNSQTTSGFCLFFKSYF